MEDNLRNILIIISGVAIAAIFIHGLWTIRKQKNPYKLKTNKDPVKPLERDFDGKGFDQDGVGQVKIIKPSNEAKVSVEDNFEEQQTPLGNSVLAAENKPQGCASVTAKSPELSELSDEITVEQAVDLQAIEELEEIILEPIYQQPVTQAKPTVKNIKKPVIRKKPLKSNVVPAEIKRNQMEINFGEGIALDNIDDNQKTPTSAVQSKRNSAKNTAEKTVAQLSPVNVEPQIIVLSVVMPVNQLMSGAALLPSLLTLGMKYGEMDIFHRHQDSAGNGGVSFSLANMVNPGSFDLDSMETFATPGVSLFMALPNAVDAFSAFDQMLAAAKHLAQEFNAQVIDDKRNVLTKQTEQHYMNKIREFDRQYRIASV